MFQDLIQNKAQFNVILEDVNSKEFVSYDIIPYLVECWKKEKNKPKNIDDFKALIKNHSMYQWWGRCEYEIVLKSIDDNIDNVLDVVNQIDNFFKYIMKNE